MNAYQIKVELEHTQPLVWRRLVIPAQVTFADLHAIIQNTLNFQDQHLYLFDLPTYNLKVTNDKEAYQLHAEYKENQAELEKTLSSLGTAFAKNQLAAMRTAVHKPEALKIDHYLQENGRLEYSYSRDDNWQISITLERVLTNYTLAYPTLLDGAEAAPPEDVRGSSGFAEFLVAYHDPEHPDHVQAQSWGRSKQFKEYDANDIASRLKKLIFATKS